MVTRRVSYIVCSPAHAPLLPLPRARPGVRTPRLCAGGPAPEPQLCTSAGPAGPESTRLSAAVGSGHPRPRAAGFPPPGAQPRPAPPLLNPLPWERAPDPGWRRLNRTAASGAGGCRRTGSQRGPARPRASRREGKVRPSTAARAPLPGRCGRGPRKQGRRGGASTHHQGLGRGGSRAGQPATLPPDGPPWCW